MPDEVRDDGGTWDSWRRLVVSEIKRLSAEHDQMLSEIHDLRIEVALLKLKSGVWGAAAGAILTAAMLLAKLLIK